MSGKDPYTSKASVDASTSEKVKEVIGIMSTVREQLSQYFCSMLMTQQVKTAMLTTRGSDGHMHSRAMAPATKEGLVLKFFANNQSGKFDELQADSHVNVSFYDQSSTDWASLSGTASLSQDNAEKEKLWNPVTKAWFGDLGDGKHTGNHDDPRVSLIVVEPTEIRYWHTTRTSVGQLTEIVSSAITGKTAAPGVLRVLDSTELSKEKERAGV